jgi:carboxyl-terminal processing protease
MDSFVKKHLVLTIVGLSILSGTFWAGTQYGKNLKPDVQQISSLTNKENDKPDQIDFAPFWKTWKLIDEKFVAKGTTTVSNQERVWGAIQGLASSMGDPFTVFMPPEENKFFENEISGSFEGVGMEVSNKDNSLIVVAPLKGTPAYKAGIQPGDKILKINDALSISMQSDQAVKLIRGPKGTTVKFLIERKGREEPFEIKVVRDTIQIPTIDTEYKQGEAKGEINGKPIGLREDGIFVIKLYNFSQPSPILFQNALREFAESGSNKLILDLRGNPGGYLEAAVDMASWFLPLGKVIVKENYGAKKAEALHRSRGYNAFEKYNLKMIILVNGGSASASEILAGALKEYGIAKLVGTKTFGKGSVQELIKVTPDTSLKVTIAKWLTPMGHSLSEGGLIPDYVVDLTEKDYKAGKDPQLNKAVEILNKSQ